MEAEWNALNRAIERGKMAVVTGLRRYGKTSLIMTYLNESKVKYVYIDCRLLPPTVSLSSFESLLEEELAKIRWGRNLLENIRSVELQFGGIGVRAAKKSEANVLRVLKALEGSVLVVDEAQVLRMSAYRFDSLLAYMFDNLDVKMIISGSEVGLLYRFLRLEDPEAPLYGRAYSEVRMGPLAREKAREFLVRGFEQNHVKLDEQAIEDALEKFDGVIGWLTYFGCPATVGGASVEKIYDMASALAVNELKKALKLYANGEPRYREALKTIATLGSASWSEVKRGVEARLGSITDSAVSNVLKNLVDSGFVKKDTDKYVIADPVLRHGVLARL